MSTSVAEAIPARFAPASRRWRAIARFTRHRPAMIGLVIVLAFILISILAPLIAPYDPDKADFAQARQGPTHAHWLGNDELGRDMFSRLIFGARLSLIVGLIPVSIGLLVGVPLGLFAGYFGRQVDMVVMRLIDIMLTFPGILLAIMMAAFLGPGLNNLMIAIGVVSVPVYTRLARGSTLAVKEEQYVEAARCIGVSHFRMLRRHIFPNILSPIIVQSSLQIAAAILSASALGFLGLGVPPDVAEWGTMLQKGRTYIFSAIHIVTFPGLAIMLVVLGFNLLGDGLRDLLDPRMSH
ncbi:MAG: ABC transporter permease [Chloroflexi bacterium]|nr:ABC transporter permease [Chloroflexota bacterium]